MSERAIATIDERLNGFGKVIFDEAKTAGLDLALACAMVKQESGGRNIFGCDHGDVGDRPPYCHQEVTRERVQKLRAGGYYTHGMNGVGLTQLTWWHFVEQAEGLGGAHIPAYQCRVGFKLMASYINKYPYMQALATYNAGETNWSNGNVYARELAAKHEAWKKLLAMAVPSQYPTRVILPDAQTWMVDEEGNYVKVPSMPNREFVTNKNEWLYAKATPAQPPAFSWPTANTPPQTSGSYVARHPTRYTWRTDVDAWARYLVANYAVWCNTYYNHPEGYWRDEDSIDVWGPSGRGYPIDMALGDKIFNLLFYDQGKPDIEWIIWRRYIYGAWNNWYGEPFGDGSVFMNHDDHIHVTYVA